MEQVVLKITASLVCSVLLCLATTKALGVMQQGGYKNKTFIKYLKRADNLFFNRLWVLSLCLFLATAVTSLCFFFLGGKGANLISAIPFIGLLFLFLVTDKKYALKVEIRWTNRLKRLFIGYLFTTACISYIFIALLGFLNEVIGNAFYRLIAFTPFTVMPMLMPCLLVFSNGVLSFFEEQNNKKYIKRAGQVFNQTEIIRIGVVGSYGKTSVKNILTTLLSEKYQVASTPKSYNTPLGIAKTVLSGEIQDKQIFIAEMGARKTGDIATLCKIVQPDFAIFTGVTQQHIETFGNIENVFAEKSEILRFSKQTVCGKTLQNFGVENSEKVTLLLDSYIQQVNLEAMRTAFVFSYEDKVFHVNTSLLGESAVENIALCILLAIKLGLTEKEIESGLAKLKPVEHRLCLTENAGVYILDDGYNANKMGMRVAVDQLMRFSGKKCLVTPGIVECGILEEQINQEFGAYLADKGIDLIILVGDTLVSIIKEGYKKAGGSEDKVQIVRTLKETQNILASWVETGACVLFLNDLPDVY